MRVDDQSLVNFINLVVGFKQDLKRFGGRPLDAAAGVVPDALLTKEDQGRIEFDFRKNAWKLLFKGDASSRKKRCHALSDAKNEK